MGRRSDPWRSETTYFLRGQPLAAGNREARAICAGLLASPSPSSCRADEVVPLPGRQRLPFATPGLADGRRVPSRTPALEEQPHERQQSTPRRPHRLGTDYAGGLPSATRPGWRACLMAWLPSASLRSLSAPLPCRTGALTADYRRSASSDAGTQRRSRPGAFVASTATVAASSSTRSTCTGVGTFASAAGSAYIGLSCLVASTAHAT